LCLVTENAWRSSAIQHDGTSTGHAAYADRHGGEFERTFPRESRSRDANTAENLNGRADRCRLIGLQRNLLDEFDGRAGTPPNRGDLMALPTSVENAVDPEPTRARPLGGSERAHAGRICRCVNSGSLAAPSVIKNGKRSQNRRNRPVGWPVYVAPPKVLICPETSRAISLAVIKARLVELDSLRQTPGDRRIVRRTFFLFFGPPQPIMRPRVRNRRRMGRCHGDVPASPGARIGLFDHLARRAH